MEKIEKIAILENVIEAQLLSSELEDREIPHLIRSYYDPAYDGIFQLAKGWGHVEAPAEFKDRILAVLHELRQAKAGPQDDVPP